MATKQTNQNAGHFARSKTTNLSISTKHSVEISRFLRYKTISFAKKYLQDVVDLKKAIPFKKFKRDIGHKVGSMAAGRYPQKAAKEFLKLISSVESNAQGKGLNTSSLKISKLISNKASIPMTGGRHRSATKRTHLEIEVVETSRTKDKKTSSKETKKETPVVEEKKEEVKVEAKPEVEEKQSEVKEEPKVEEKEIETKKETPVVEEKKEEVKVEAKPEVEEKQSEVKEEPKVEGKEIETKKETPVVEEKKEEVKAETKQPVKELSSEELLEKAQETAAELNKNQEQAKDVQDVSNLYDELQKKGTLRKGEEK